MKRCHHCRGNCPVTKVGAGMTRTTFDVILETMLGGSARFDVERYGRALTESFEATQCHMVCAMVSAPGWIPFPGRRRAMRARDDLLRGTQALVWYH